MADDQNPQNRQGGQNPPLPPPPPIGGGFPPNPFPPAGGAKSGAGGFTPAQPPPEDTTPANYKIGTKLPPVISVQIPQHNLNFDEQNFLHLLAGSISLSKDEKKRIISSIPKLKQEQVDELIRIFEEEQRKFAELSAKHVDQLKKLENQHSADWQDIEMEQKASSKQNEDQAQADEIRKKLGL